MYTYEVWLEGQCLRNSEDFDGEYYTEIEAEEEAEAEIYTLLFDEGYSKDGYDFDDFTIIVR